MFVRLTLADVKEGEMDNALRVCQKYSNAIL